MRWSNQVGAAKVVRSDPDGRVERERVFPVPQAVGSTFGEPDLSTLYVTTAQGEMSHTDQADHPLSGSLFAVPVGIRGLPTALFAG